MINEEDIDKLPRASEPSRSILDPGMTDEEAEAWRVKQEEKRKAREQADG